MMGFWHFFLDKWHLYIIDLFLRAWWLLEWFLSLCPSPSKSLDSWVCVGKSLELCTSAVAEQAALIVFFPNL